VRKALEAAIKRCQEFLDTFDDMRDYVTQADIDDWNDVLAASGEAKP
jgi:hypothetical protein